MLVKDETSYTSKIEEAKTFNDFGEVMNYCVSNKLDKTHFTILTTEEVHENKDK